MTIFKTSSVKRNPRGAYSLVELLVVISIIGVLASVVLGNLSQSRNEARDANIRQLARSIMVTAQTIRLEKGDYLFRNATRNHIGTITKAGSCDAIATQYSSLSATQNAEFVRLCRSIQANSSLSNSSSLLLMGTVDVSTDSIPAPDYSRTFSVMVRLNSGDWFCIGASGNTYEGPHDDGAVFGQPGCRRTG